MTARLLIAEDDDGIALPLTRTLRREGYDVARVSQGRAAAAQVIAGRVDLVILDLGLPDMDGLEVCQEIRAGGGDCPVLILSARDGELDRVTGLDVGADDYLAKPFALAELLARIRALLRRHSAHVGGSGHAASRRASAGSASTTTLAEEGLRLDTASRRTWVRERELLLSRKEFEVLERLIEERGSVVSRERLMDEVWDVNWFGSTKTLDTTVARLRQKLEQSESPWQVVTVRGIGFRLHEVADDA